MTTVINVENLGKRYLIGHEKQERYSTLRDSINHSVKSISRRLLHPLQANIEETEEEEFWALKDINFEIQQGDKVGIIGRNGAGKSTLLKILSRITTPTTGKITLKGRVASLLEVGTGFHPELSGRENIFLNGAILGMRKAEIERKFDEIVDFAEVEKFLDTPVKRYSSGMYVRLAFAVAAHLESEILIVDEVLSVGDAEFQKKCLGKIEDISIAGRTVLFVSHNLPAITNLCEKCILIGSGKIKHQGSTNEIIKQYLSPRDNNTILHKNFKGPLRKTVIFNEITINNKKENGLAIKPNEDILIEVSGISKLEMDGFRMTLSIHQNGLIIFTTRDCMKPERLKEGTFTFQIKIPSYLLRPGYYSIAIGGKKSYYSDWVHGVDIFDFYITEEWDFYNEKDNLGIINIPFNGQRYTQ